MLGIKQDEESKSTGDSWIGPAPAIEGPLPGPIAKAFIERDEKVTSTSYTRDYPLVVKRASGSIVEDVDGNRFLDFAAGIAVCSTGHCHPKVTKAMIDQINSLVHICGSDFYYESMVQLVEKLAQIAPGNDPKRVFLTNSGAEAVEGAIKLARHHTKRKGLIAFHGAFHGRTMGALSLTCSKARQKENFGPFIPMVHHAPYGDVDYIEEKLFKYLIAPEEVAAIFVEALQGEGGYIVPDPEFLPRLRKLCDKYKILLVCDEIQSGAGRTGKWFACDHFNVVPDIVLMAKGMGSGMPIGALIAKANIMDWPPGAHGSTYGGNPVACASAVATLELIENGMMDAAAKMGEKLMTELNKICDSRKVVSNARGLGMMCAVDIINPRTGKGDAKIREKILMGVFDRGLILLGCGETSIRFCTPLCINETQLETGLKIFDEVVATVC